MGFPSVLSDTGWKISAMAGELFCTGSEIPPVKGVFQIFPFSEFIIFFRVIIQILCNSELHPILIHQQFNAGIFVVMIGIHKMNSLQKACKLILVFENYSFYFRYQIVKIKPQESDLSGCGTRYPDFMVFFT